MTTAKEIFEEQTQEHEFPEPFPLVPKISPSPPYPVEYLMGLQPVAEAIHDTLQSPMAFGAQSAMAAIALVTQSFVNVEMPFGSGQEKPTSLFFLTGGPTGSGKTISDDEVLPAIRFYFKIERERHESKLREYDLDKREWEAKTQKAGKDRAALSQLGNARTKPPIPMLILDDPTWPGIWKFYSEGRKSLGLFTTEGGMLLGGYSMKVENKTQTITGFSKLHDGDAITRARVGDAIITIIEDCRLSMHLMMQPHLLMAFFTDQAIIDQGLLSRGLISYPETTIGKRLLRGHTPKDSSVVALRDWFDRITELLKRGDKQDVRQIIRLTPSAKDLWIEYHDDHEQRLVHDLAGVVAFVNKCAELVVRVAANLAIFNGKEDIDEDAIASAAMLMEYYIDEVLRLNDAARRADPDMKLAQKLSNWLFKRGEARISLRDIMRNGPGQTRVKSDALRIISILDDNHHLIRDQSQKDDTWFVNAKW